MMVFHYKTTVGYYLVGKNHRFHVKEKPSWFHRMMVKLILGWEYVDEKESE